MSKTAKTAQRAMDVDFSSKTEATTNAHFIKTGRKTITRVEAEKLFGDAADLLNLQFSRMDHNMKAIAEAEILVAKEAKALMQRGKDLANQVGDSMARIDKVMESE